MPVIERDYRDPADPGRVTDDPFLRVADEDPLPNGVDVLVSLERFEREGRRRHTGRLGVIAPGDTDPARLASVAAEVDELGLELPKFTDGRAYSSARILRDRYGYRGRLRAVGHVLHDQLLYLSRCGFDVFELTAGKDVDGALKAFAAFSVRYQAAADEPLPHWKRVRARGLR